MFRFSICKKCNSYSIFHIFIESKIQYHITYILAVNIIRTRRYKCKIFIASSLVNDMASLVELPWEVLVYYIFPYLRPEDIFNIGEWSEDMKRIVLDNSRPPLLTHSKNMRKWCDRKNTVYDNESPFRNMEKCLKYDCKCQKFSHRKDVVDLKISKCVKYFIGIESYCYKHDTLNVSNILLALSLTATSMIH